VIDRMRDMAASWWKKLAGGWGERSNGAGRVTSEPLRRFRADVKTALAGALDRAAIDGLLQRPAAEGLSEDDVELEVEALHGAVDLLDLQARVERDGLPVIAHQHKALAGERCAFIASVSLADEATQRTGRLFLTDRRLVFVSTPLVALPWGAIQRIVDDGRDLIVAAPGRGALHRFRCNSFADARCGRWLAERLRDEARDAPGPSGQGGGPGL
jgi:hypothetical protein